MRGIIRDVCNHCYTRPVARKMDESEEDWHRRRKGSGRDPKNRKRSCPHCHGTGRADYCATCGEVMDPRCSGRAAAPRDGFMGDAPPCAREGRSDRRTYPEIQQFNERL